MKIQSRLSLNLEAILTHLQIAVVFVIRHVHFNSSFKTPDFV